MRALCRCALSLLAGLSCVVLLDGSLRSEFWDLVFQFTQKIAWSEIQFWETWKTTSHSSVRKKQSCVLIDCRIPCRTILLVTSHSLVLAVFELFSMYYNLLFYCRLFFLFLNPHFIIWFFFNFFSQSPIFLPSFTLSISKGYDPVGWGLPYGNFVATDTAKPLMESAVQVHVLS